MLYRLVKIVMLAAALGGLCAPMHANTTSPQPIDGLAGMPHSTGGATIYGRVAQTDLSIARDIVFPPDTASASSAQNSASSGPSVRVALLLPLLSDTFRPAADAVRAGFLAAHEREKDGISVGIIETGDASQDILSGYTDAVARHDIVVGPLSRSGAAAVAQSGAVSKPTIVLAQLDPSADTSVKTPKQLLEVGLSIEAEARQVARWAGANKKLGKALVVSTDSAWQRRAAGAFAAQWEKQGKELNIVELTAFSGYLGAKELADLKKTLEADKPALVFAALDATQAQQLRAAVGNDIPMYGTSQLNPFTLTDRAIAERIAGLDGTRLLDIPWQLMPDHPAVMIYPRPAVVADQKRSADLERLYALGIDAYRIAREIALKRNSFELDGVTGKLTVRFGTDAPFFERTEQPAIYRDGSVMAVVNPR